MLNLRDRKVTSNRNEIRVNCPVCGDTKYHCYVNIQQGIFHCFRCNSSGRLQKIEDLPRISISEKKINNWYLDQHIEPFGDSYYQKRAVEYWYSRGFTKQEMLDYNIQINPTIPSISIPIYTENGELSFYLERKIFAGRGLRFIIPPGTKISNFLFNFHKAKYLKKVILVEGALDAIAIGNSGIALLGKRLHDKQLDLLKSSDIKSIAVFLDRDARKEISVVSDMLLPYFEVHTVISIEDKDPSDYRKEYGNERLKELVKDYVS